MVEFRRRLIGQVPDPDHLRLVRRTRHRRARTRGRLEPEPAPEPGAGTAPRSPDQTSANRRRDSRGERPILGSVTRTHKIVNLIGVPLPLVGLIAAIVLLWNQAIGPLELGLLVGLYVFTALGVTLGYHRMFTHRAFESSRAFRAIVAVLGSMAMQGSVITWVADHRKHHTFTDQDGDPHSPHLSGPGFWGGVKGLWHAHVGWLFETVGTADRERFAADLLKDGVLRVIDKLFFVWVVLGFAIPFALGWIVGGGIGAALTAVLWGGFVRVFLLHHVTWSINSVCHFFGSEGSMSRTSRATCSGSRRCRWARPGTTTTMRSRRPRFMVCVRGSGWPTRPDCLIAAAREARDRLERRPRQPRAPAREVAPRRGPAAERPRHRAVTPTRAAPSSARRRSAVPSTPRPRRADRSTRSRNRSCRSDRRGGNPERA